MCALQVAWLSAVWMAGVSSGGSTPLVLAAIAIVLFAAAVLLPGSSWSWLARAIRSGDRSTASLLAVLSLCVAAAGVLYAVSQPPLPDEDSALAAARILTNEGVPRFFEQYAGIDWLGVRHPPLVPLVFGAFVELFGDTLVALRLASLGFLVATLLVTYQLGRHLYDRATGLFAALALALIPYTFRVGVAARTDMAVTFFGAAALLFALRIVDRPGWPPIVGTGLSIGLAVLCKYSALLMLPVLPLLFLWRRAAWAAWMRLAAASIVAAVIVSPWIAFAYENGVFEAQARTIVLFVGGAALDTEGVHHHSAVRYQLELLLTSLPSGIGVHNLALILPGIWMLARRRQMPDAAILIWIGGIALLLLLVLPDPRYFMLTFPALAVLMARVLGGIERGVEPVVALGLLYCGEAVYLYTAAIRTAYMFAR